MTSSVPLSRLHFIVLALFLASLTAAGTLFWENRKLKAELAGYHAEATEFSPTTGSFAPGASSVLPSADETGRTGLSAERTVSGASNSAAFEAESASTGANTPNPARPWQTRMLSFMEALSDPDTRQLAIDQTIDRLEGRFAPMFANLNLPPAELELLKILMAEKELARLESRMLASSGQDRSSRREAWNWLAEQERVLDDEIESLLGPDRTAELRFFENTQRERAVVQDFAQRLAFNGQPLAPSQSEQLVRILHEEQARFPEAFPQRGGGWWGNNDPSAEQTQSMLAARADLDKAVLSRALQVLNEDQFTLFAERRIRETEAISQGISIFGGGPVPATPMGGGGRRGP